MSLGNSDTVTLALEGEVSLDDFAAAIGHFRGLLGALIEEIGEGAVARWVIDELSGGSARATSRAIPTVELAPAAVSRVIHGYLQVGRALEERLPVTFAEGRACDARPARHPPQRREHPLRDRGG